jgi:hypothetical protein
MKKRIILIIFLLTGCGKKEDLFRDSKNLKSELSSYELSESDCAKHDMLLQNSECIKLPEEYQKIQGSWSMSLNDPAPNLTIKGKTFIFNWPVNGNWSKVYQYEGVYQLGEKKIIMDFQKSTFESSQLVKLGPQEYEFHYFHLNSIFLISLGLQSYLKYPDKNKKLY